MKDRKEMTEMTEMNKAFDDFDKACAKAIDACQDFIDMDIKTTKPVIELDEDGKFMTIDGVLHSVINHHSFDDYGGTIDTLTVMNYASDVKEVYSFDEGETFTFESGEH